MRNARVSRERLLHSSSHCGVRTKSHRIAHVKHLLDVDDNVEDVKYRVFDLADGEHYWYVGKRGEFEASLLVSGKDHRIVDSWIGGSKFRQVVVDNYDIDAGKFIWSCRDPECVFSPGNSLLYYARARFNAATVWRLLREKGAFDRYTQEKRDAQVRDALTKYAFPVSKGRYRDMNVIDLIMQYYCRDHRKTQTLYWYSFNADDGIGVTNLFGSFRIPPG